MKNPLYRELRRVNYGRCTPDIVTLPLMRFRFFEREHCLDMVIVFGIFWGLPEEKFHVGEMVYRRQLVLVWKGWPLYFRNY